jgi:hypothetical protein
MSVSAANTNRNEYERGSQDLRHAVFQSYPLKNGSEQPETSNTHRYAVKHRLEPHNTMAFSFRACSRSNLTMGKLANCSVAKRICLRLQKSSYRKADLSGTAL